MQYTKDVLYKIKALERVLFIYIKIKERDDSMEKIILKNGQEFELVPNGINTNEYARKRTFIFKPTLAQTETLEMFSDFANTEKIDYILGDGTVGKTYLDCVSLKKLGFIPNYKLDENTTADVYSVELSIDPVERQLRETQDKNKELEEKLTIIDGAFWDILINFIPNIPIN